MAAMNPRWPPRIQNSTSSSHINQKVHSICVVIAPFSSCAFLVLHLHSIEITEVTVSHDQIQNGRHFLALTGESPTWASNILKLFTSCINFLALQQTENLLKDTICHYLKGYPKQLFYMERRKIVK